MHLHGRRMERVCRPCGEPPPPAGPRARGKLLSGFRVAGRQHAQQRHSYRRARDATARNCTAALRMPESADHRTTPLKASYRRAIAIAGVIAIPAATVSCCAAARCVPAWAIGFGRI
jgi:hypothetical protein